MPAFVRLACLLLTSLCALPARAVELDLIFAADLDGDFGPGRCHEATPKAGGLPMLAAAIQAARETGSQPIVIGGPGLLGPGILGRYLLSSESGAGHAARLILSAGFDVFCPGTYEFVLPPAALRAYLRGLLQGGREVVLSNLRCPKAAQPGLCETLAPEAIFERGGVRVAVLGVVGEDLPRRVGPGHEPGEILAPARIAERVKALRRRAEAIVLVSDIDRAPDPGGAVALVQALEEQGAHVDVVLAARMDHRAAPINAVTLRNRTWIVGAQAGGAGVVVLPLRYEGTPPVLSVRPPRRVDASASSPAAPLTAEVERLHGELCQAWGRPLLPVPAGERIGRRRLTTLALDAMRAAAKADLALLNAGAIDEGGLPLLAFSQEALLAAIPFPSRVVLLKVKGQVLREQLKRYAPDAKDPLPLSRPRRRREADPRAVLPLLGLVNDDGTLKVNGRPLEDATTYRVATIDFLVSGGDGLLSSEFQISRVIRDSLQDLLLEHLAAHSDDPEAVLRPLPLDSQPLWTAGLDLGLDLQNVTVNNPQGGYDRPLLLRRPSIALKIDGTARLQLDQPRHLLQLSVRGLYGGTYVAAEQDGQAGWQETADLVGGLLLYSFRGLRPGLLRLPTPYLSIGVEAEWDRPAARAYHHLEVSALLGARTAIVSKLSATFGFGVRRELLAQGSSSDRTEADVARARFLVSVTLELQKRALWPKLGDMLLSEFALTYNFTDPGKLHSHELRTTGKLYVAIGRPLYVTLGADLYLYADRGRDPGVALDLTAGIKVLLDARTQVF